jgi:hypothetical protein
MWKNNPIYRVWMLSGCLSLLCHAIPLHAQIQQIARFEREQKNSDPEFIIIPTGARGMVLFRDKDKYKEGRQLWEMIRLDSDLNEVWNMELDVKAGMRLIGYDHKDAETFLLFRASDHEASNLHLFAVNIQSQEIKRYEIKQELSIRITHFGILLNAIVVGGYISNEPAVMIYDFEKEGPKIVPGFFVSNTELLDLRINTNNTFNTLIIDQKNREQKKLIIKTFDSSGALLLEDAVDIEGKRTILSGITSTLQNDDLLIAGTWTVGTSRSAAGIYTVVVDPFSDQPIRYYDFGQLKHFFDYQSERKANKLRQKSMQARASGSIPDIRAHASLMRLDEHPNGFVLLQEVFQPSSSMNTSPYWNDFSNPYYYGYMPYTYSPFMNRYYTRPYQYNYPASPSGENKILHASVVLFDLKGQLLDDFGLEIKDKKSNTVEQTSDFLLVNGKVAIAYKKEKEIFFLRGAPDEEEGIQETIDIAPNEPGEIIRSDSDHSFVRFWYDHYMYAWGYQRIRDTRQSSEDPTRYVFYIIKIRVD